MQSLPNVKSFTLDDLRRAENDPAEAQRVAERRMLDLEIQNAHLRMMLASSRANEKFLGWLILALGGSLLIVCLAVVLVT